jgi:integrase
MGTITARKHKDGSTGYRAQVRVMRDGKSHSETETFDRKALAQQWMRMKEAELDQRRARGEPLGRNQTLGDLIDWYVEEIGDDAEWGRTKAADLKRIRKAAIAKLVVTSITTPDYIRHAEARKAEGAGPATVGNDFVWIGQVLKSARATLGVLADLSRLDDARHALRQRKLIAKSQARERRLQGDEEGRLLEYFANRDGRADIPMVDVFRFAIATSRRVEEITRIKWANLDEAKGVAMLEDVKHPTRKKGNDRTFRLLSEGWEIIKAQPKRKAGLDNEYIFPYNPRSIGAAFTRACKFLGIRDLHFHDLRHEATSRFFERGYSIQEVAHFTLHDSWETLKRYTHLRPEQVPERRG